MKISIYELIDRHIILSDIIDRLFLFFIFLIVFHKEIE